MKAEMKEVIVDLLESIVSLALLVLVFKALFDGDKASAALALAAATYFINNVRLRQIERRLD